MKPFTRFFRLFALVLLWGSLSAPAHAASTKDVEKFIDSLGNRVLELLQDKSISDAQKEAQLRTIFRDNVDTDWIGKFVLGKYWREAKPEQQTRYLSLYRDFLIESYTGRFKEYSGESFRITGSRAEGSDKFVLNTEIVRPKQASVVVDYKVKTVTGGFKVYDIVVEGVSLITTQRSEFTSVVSRSGMDALISALQQRTGKKQPS
jgi:phospholipid transport system substrate-binding protein